MGKKVLKGTTKVKAITMLAEGHTQQQVADAAKVTQKAISKFAAKPEIREQIQGLQYGIVQEAGELAKDNTVRTVSIANQILRLAAECEHPGKVIEDNRVALDLSDKKEKRVLTLMGISGAPTMPIFLQQVFQNTSFQDESQEVESVGKYLAWKQEQDIQEAELVETEEAGEPEGK